MEPVDPVLQTLLTLAGLGAFGLLLIGSLLGVVGAFRLNTLERRTAELAERLKRLESGTSAAASGEVTPSAAAAAERPVVEGPLASVGETSSDRSSTRGLDLESLIAGRWLNRVGIITVLIAAALFLKFAFDNQWVGAIGRVAIGLAAGFGLLVMGERQLRKGYSYFSEGITALGGGVLVLSIFAAWDLYDLIPRAGAFAGLLLVTAVLVWLALRRDSERLAILALGVGFLVLGLLGILDQVPLFGYLAILVGGFLFLAAHKGWRLVAPLALLGTLIYLWTWIDERYSPARLLETLAFATLFFVEFAAHFLSRLRSAPDDSRWPLRVELLLLPINAGWYGFLLYTLLVRDHRGWLTAAVLMIGVLHLAAARWVSGRGSEESSARLILGGLALSFITVAIPIRLEGEAIPIALAIEATLLIWTGFRAEMRAVRGFGIVLFVAVVGQLVEQSSARERLLLNARFASFAVAVVALALSTHWARTRWEGLEPTERQLFGVLAIAVSAVAVWGLSEEIWYALGRQALDADTRFARQMGLSLLWTFAASLLIFVGVKWRWAALRWQGLVLLGITVLKVFLLDLSFLERAYRIASFLVLGTVLLAVSFWYQRSISLKMAEGSSAGPDAEDRG
jgi:uncharacterized membrane protein